ncbi:FtsX-like permease family protein [Patescibacteria group bacterium]|nr:FtsX-like permease family protein [Patescibacteria group bacterium]
MKLNYNIQINFKKLKRHRSRALFLIVPIALLVSLIIVISSQVSNIHEAAKISIFGTIEEQNTLIELKKDTEQFSSHGFGFSPEDLYYTENDIAVIEAIDNVADTQILAPAPINDAVTTDLVENLLLAISRLTPLDSEVAGLYTDQNFSYIPDEPIPIVLNANSFIEVYEDWGGQDEIAIARSSMGRGDPAAMQNSSPIKSRSIEYDKNQLLGKEIIIRFSDLPKMQSYETEMTQAGMVFRKLTQEAIDEKERERQDEISQYWNYEKITTPLEYTFKIVGIIESESNRNVFVPKDFVDELMRQYIQRQINARTEVALPLDILGSTFSGLEYDGLELTGGAGATALGRFGGGIRISRDTQQGDSYTIPGLVIEIAREETEESVMPFGEGSSDVIGEYQDPNVYEFSVQNGEILLIKINKIDARGQVIGDLNKLGYAYHDLSDMDVFEELKSTLNIVSTASVVAYIALSIIIVIFTMGKFIAESKKEIGILRAIGATKNDIKLVFIIQAVLYTVVGYLAGVLGGVLMNLALAKPLSVWFNSFISKTIQESFSVVNPTELSVFSNINWSALAIYSVVLFIITTITSIIPATNASNISPVEAIRGE